MKLKCIKNVVMNDQSIAFVEGVVYNFKEKPGGVLICKDSSIHAFHNKGSDSWDTYFIKVK